jgi:hypothetical protein
VGYDGIITWPQTVTVTSQVSDDGLPYGILDYWWTQEEGLGVATFDNPYALETGVSFSGPGAYRFRLYVTDGEYLRSADVVIRVDPPPPLPTRLAGFSFDSTTLLGERGQTPLVSAGLLIQPSWYGSALIVNNPTGDAQLTYRVVEDSDGSRNIDLANGSVAFWFKPHWTSASLGGTGPGNTARLIDVGDAGTNSVAWWGLHVDSTGNTLSFGTKGDGVTTTNVSASIAWQSNAWHEIVLTYSPTNSALYIDGLAVATGSGVMHYPTAEESIAGLTIGSGKWRLWDEDHWTWMNGNQARGTFEQLDTFNEPMQSATVTWNFVQTANAIRSNLASNGGGTGGQPTLQPQQRPWTPPPPRITLSPPTSPTSQPQPFLVTPIVTVKSVDDEWGLSWPAIMDETGAWWSGSSTVGELHWTNHLSSFTDQPGISSGWGNQTTVFDWDQQSRVDEWTWLAMTNGTKKISSLTYSNYCGLFGPYSSEPEYYYWNEGWDSVFAHGPMHTSFPPDHYGLPSPTQYLTNADMSV